MKSLMWLLRCVLADASTQCSTDTHADYKTIVRRCKDEGDSFLTITLPNFCKTFERSLAEGRWTSVLCTSFRTRNGLPVFLQGFLRQIFAPDGTLLDVPSIEAIRCIRQICLMWKKIHLPCSKERTREAFNGYIECDKQVEQAVANTPIWAYGLFGDVSDVLWSTTLHDADYSVVFREYYPRHGPGATAERVLGNSKWRSKRWTHRLNQQYFPYHEFVEGRAYWDGNNCGLNDVELAGPEQESPVRVISVPKTQTAPRIIAIEPVCMQYAQQALLPLLTETLETHPLTRGRVNFTSQSFNREVALSSSKSGKLATLDLKEASDRVALQHVIRMLDSVPDLLGAILACRSRAATVPTFTGKDSTARVTVELHKFASMGSALCFPIEAMVFYTLIIAARIHAADVPVNLSNIVKYSKDVLVYGDDIVVPVDSVQDVISFLGHFGILVNSTKSFWTGKFRESCGLDAYDGVEVTPFYVRHSFPDNVRSATQLASWVSFANQAYKHGFWQVAKETRRRIEQLTGELPHVSDTAEGLGWFSFLGTQTVHRWNASLFRFETKSLCIRTKRYDDPLDDREALLKCLLTVVGSPNIDDEHLEQSTRRGSVYTKSHWFGI